MTAKPSVLSIHAVDLAAEDGVVSDASVAAELGCRGLPAVTALRTGGDGTGILHVIDPDVLLAQLDAVRRLESPAAVRTGFLADDRQIEVVAAWCTRCGASPVVAVPAGRHTDSPGAPTRAESLVSRLYPLARVVVARASDVVGATDAVELDAVIAAARAFREDGARACLLSGVPSAGRVVDVLDDGGHVTIGDVARIAAPRLPGLGGAHVAALAAHLARGLPLDRAAVAAQRYVVMRLQAAR